MDTFSVNFITVRAMLPYIMYNDGSSFKRKTIELVTAN